MYAARPLTPAVAHTFELVSVIFKMLLVLINEYALKDNGHTGRAQLLLSYLQKEISRVSMCEFFSSIVK